MPGKNTSFEIRRLVIRLWLGGRTRAEIASIINRSWGTVNNTIKHFKATGGYLKIGARGARAKVTAADIRLLILNAKREPFATARELLTNAKLNHKITPHRLNEILHSRGLGCRRPRRKPYLQPRHRRARYAWAVARKDWTIDDWKECSFDDESTFETGKPSGGRLCRRLPSTEFVEKNVIPTFKSGRSTSNHWGAIQWQLKSKLVCLRGQGRMNATKYRDLIVNRALKEFIQEIKMKTGTDVTVMEDNASCHNAKVVVAAYEKLNIFVSDWPAQSPDLNPIENLWNIIKEAIAKLPVAKSVEELERQVQEEWERIPQETIQKLIESMPRRIEAVIQAKGGLTKY